MSRTYSEVFPDLPMAPPTSNTLLRAREVKVTTVESLLYQTHGMSLMNRHAEDVKRELDKITDQSTFFVAVRSAAREGSTTVRYPSSGIQHPVNKLTTRLYIFDSENHFDTAWDLYDAERMTKEQIPQFEKWEPEPGTTYPESRDGGSIVIPDNGDMALISKDGRSIAIEIEHLEHVLQLHKDRKEH